MTALLKAGDKITCTNGHVIGEVLQDIDIGTMAWGQHIGNWRQKDHPVMGAMHQPVCETCGARFVGKDDDSWNWSLHISGWRP